jgi:hypothetical protein
MAARRNAHGRLADAGERELRGGGLIALSASHTCHDTSWLGRRQKVILTGNRQSTQCGGHADAQW